MRVIIAKDPHSSYGFNNIIRVNYNADYDAKLAFIQKYYHENNIDAFVTTGDMFDNSYLEKWSFSHYIANINKWDILKKSGMNILTIDGNHDQFSGTYSFSWKDRNGNIKSTVYGDCVNRGIFTHIPHNPKTIDNSVFYGIGYKHTKDEVISELNEISANIDSSKFNIVVLHQNVTPHPINHITDFTYDELSEFENINCFILGHYHVGYPTEMHKGILFINPWNLFRVSRDYEVQLDKHIPEIIDLEIRSDDNGEFNINYTHIELPHKSFDDAFVYNFKDEIKKKAKKDDTNLFDEIHLDDVRSEVSDQDIIELIGEKSDKFSESDTNLAKSLMFENN